MCENLNLNLTCFHNCCIKNNIIEVEVVCTHVFAKHTTFCINGIIWLSNLFSHTKSDNPEVTSYIKC